MSMKEYLNNNLSAHLLTWIGHAWTNKVLKILNGHENIDPNIFVKIKTDKRTRGLYVSERAE